MKNDKAERTNRRVFIKRSAEVGAVGAEEETTRTSFDAKGPLVNNVIKKRSLLL